jgi:hypothetical protein
MGEGAVTRRSLLARAAAGGGALALGRVAPAAAARRPPETVVFALPVPAGRHSSARAAAAGPWIEAEPVRSPKRFDLLGLEWKAPHAARIQLRTRSAGGPWSRWIELHPGGAHGPDGAAAPAEGRLVTDPIWVGGADAFQIRSSVVLRGMRMHLVNSTGTATPAARARAAVASVLAPARAAQTLPVQYAGQPPIIPRSAWADRGCRPRRAASYGRVELAFVHHTATLNNYRPRDSAAMVRGICHFHKYVQGWDDIGYNFLVDRYGQIFEGRAGGIDEAVIGAQAGGYNAFSTGIGNLGAFNARSQSAAGLRALAKIIAWKLALHGVAAAGRVDVEVSRSGARYSRYPAGAEVSLNRISGHRDACTTDCPGGALYRQLPRLRRRVAQAIPDPHVLVLSDPSDAQGDAVSGTQIAGRLTTRGGAPVGGAQIELQVYGAHAKRTAGRAVTAADGTFAATVALTANAFVRAVDRGDAGRPAVVSEPVLVPVRPHIELSAGSPGAVPGTPVQLSGLVAPVKRRVTIAVAAQSPDGTFHEVQDVPVAAAPDGRFAYSLTLSAPGTYEVVARTAADKRNAVGFSAPVRIVVA